jgi:NADPH:quinone reductase-like Zn-dependent oxidoreductase
MVGHRLKLSGTRPSVTSVRAVQITCSGGPEVLDVVDLPDPVPGDGEQLYEVSAAGINFADTHHRRSAQRTV